MFTLQGKLPGYFNKRRKASLFQQWVDKAELPPGEIPAELLNGQKANETSITVDDTDQDEVSVGHYSTPIMIDSGMVSLPYKYVLIGIGIFVVMLVSLSVVITILFMRPG